MTTHSSAPPQGTRDNFDAGSLSWVMGEIREALGRSKTAIFEAVAQDADARSTSLRQAKTFLHQAHGALQIVDIDGVAIITETTEDLLDRLESGQIELSDDIAHVIENAYQALTEYLEELLSGASHQPVRLFPYYKSLLEARGAERVHPADLFFPNLAIRPQLPPIDAAAFSESIDYVGLRQRFEKALLPFLRKNDPASEAANARAMLDIVAQVERTQSNQQSRAFWWVLHALAEAVAAGQIPKEIYVKQLFARINLQIRRLSEGSASIAERLLRDALFFIARVEKPSPRAAQVRAAYQLDGLVPVDYDKKRYGQIDTEALALAKSRLNQAKNLWNRIVAGDAAVADAFGAEMKGLTETVSKLGSPSLLKLLRELNGIARHAAATSQSGGALGLEMATCLLFVENALGNISRLPEDFTTRADAMTARLLSIVAGETPTESAPWFDEMSREAQQRQTMAALGGEMQNSLRQVEKLLDDYFREPEQRSALTQIEPILHQISGALAILDQDDALRAVEHTQEAVRNFIDSPEDSAPDVEAFRHVAQNVGALSFFIETLQLQPESAKQRFSFDADKGMFCAKLLERDEQDDVGEQVVVVPALEENQGDVSDPAALSEAAEEVLPTVEQELELHQKQSAELARCLSAEPTDTRLQEQLKESLEQVQLAAALVDNPEAGERARAAMDLLENATAEDALATLVPAAADAVPVSEPVATPTAVPVAEASDEEVDAELLEIFLFEAEEVLACVNSTIPLSRHEPKNQEHLTTLRRSFHTLKGSGRMVGLTAFGEAAWSIEQVMNLRLADGAGGDAQLYALLEKAAELLAVWVEDLQTQGRSARRPDALIAAAERVKNREPFSYEEVAAEPVPPAEAAADATMPPANEDDAAEEVIVGEAVVPADYLDESPELADVEALAPLEDETADQVAPAETMFAQVDEVIEATDAGGAIELTEALQAFEPAEPIEAGAVIETVEFDALTEDNAAQAVDGLAIDEALAQMEMPELTIDLPENEAASIAEEPQNDLLLEEFELPQPAPVAEVIEFPTMQAPLAARDDGVKYIGDLEISVPLHNIYLAETDDLVRMLANDIAEWRHEPEREVNILAVHAAHSLAGSSATVGFQALQEVAHGLEMALQCLSRKPTLLSDEEFGVLEASIEQLKAMLQMFALGEMPAHEPQMVQALADLRQAIETRTADLPVETVADALDPIAVEPTLAELEAQEAQAERIAASEPEVQIVPEAAPQLTSLPVEPMPVVPELSSFEPQPADIIAKPAENDAVAPAIVIKDELDADLLPVFLEEGRDMLPEVGEKLRAWQQTPVDTSLPQALLRLLHTVKGSARMAGAMELGQHMHELETRIEAIMHAGLPSAQSLDDLLARYDYGLQLFEVLQNPDAARPVAIDPAAEVAVAAESGAPAASPTRLVELNSIIPARPAGFAATPAPVAQKAVAAGAAAPLVRVRADILDRLVNQAGEVSISRSKLETEVGTLRGSLAELTENINRLRTQLREIEMQAESQISSRMSQTGERDFDPLEFDRFTRLQELTRMMAESVNDVSSVQQNLLRTVDSASNDLVSQARLTRDLQQDLMRVRMVQFASISERLFRVTRQASKELDKRVNLDIRGGTVELDRSVLERMAGPFEHLLRNAIVHGIESKDKRRASGKNEIGELLIEIRQEGNEVVIQFTDDGQGLNVDRIREKAQTQGLLSDGMSESEITDLIFHPGFSTAESVTELAGRGVGMDVVRSEAAALGGRVALKSDPGKGAQFTIHLPLTLAVTQVVLLSTGGKVFAVPSVLVEQVQQLKTNMLTAAYNEGAVMWQGQRVPMHYLSTLLGDRDATAVAQQYTPLVIMKSGSDRVALHVDEVIGNREVVVKNIGPQLARMIGVAGATVLGSGDIVLILNPVPLAQRAAQENIRAPRLVPSDAPENMGAVAEMAVGKPSAPKSDAVQGLRTQNIVMVVDDSLTVRRVTQRLLVREGYQVVLAKDGVDALEQLQAVTPDVMLVDIEMPRMDGFDLTRNVRGDERTRHIPIIMITSRTATKHRNYAMELGVNEYLGKPYQEDDLLKSIAGFISKEASVS
ncbi:chemosensory pili system protein ChpA (sensor histidine kinase/response regulator) [Paucimonas lemoignei]|uniref:Chemotaxis protein CheA n=1 Tax=Paucimonas lemoignei TaxID=29443 RepID=A0A4R3HX64_PAULE|nr:Hpt domain-containing protein [Paucimonas lemoignei]TCS36861.1 chemosensory pili system protein ChpA (sensor histidine kinase/response regulator) [Paucimonas lemoignei]